MGKEVAFHIFQDRHRLLRHHANAKSVRAIDDKIAALAAQNAPQRFLKDIAKWVWKMPGRGAIVDGTETETFATAGIRNIGFVLFVKSKVAIPDLNGILGLPWHVLARPCDRENLDFPLYQDGILMGFRRPDARNITMTVNATTIDEKAHRWTLKEMEYEFELVLDRKRKREICKPLSDASLDSFVFKDTDGKLFMEPKGFGYYQNRRVPPIFLADIKEPLGIEDNIVFNTGYFLIAMKDAGCVLRIFRNGGIDISFETDYAAYTYRLIGKKRN